MIKKIAEAILPPDVIHTDKHYPESFGKNGRRLRNVDEVMHELGEHGRLTFYNTEGFGWCIATLQIRKSRRQDRSDRTYAVRCRDGEPVRVGLGPHVKSTVTIYIKKSRVKALQKYIDLFNKGAVDANNIRDRISSRRAQGALRRNFFRGF